MIDWGIKNRVLRVWLARVLAPAPISIHQQPIDVRPRKPVPIPIYLFHLCHHRNTCLPLPIAHCQEHDVLSQAPPQKYQAVHLVNFQTYHLTGQFQGH